MRPEPIYASELISKKIINASVFFVEPPGIEPGSTLMILRLLRA